MKRVPGGDDETVSRAASATPSTADIKQLTKLRVVRRRASVSRFAYETTATVYTSTPRGYLTGKKQ